MTRPRRPQAAARPRGPRRRRSRLSLRPGQYPPGQYPPGQYPQGQYPPGQYPYEPARQAESEGSSGWVIAFGVVLALALGGLAAAIISKGQDSTPSATAEPVTRTVQGPTTTVQQSTTTVTAPPANVTVAPNVTLGSDGSVGRAGRRGRVVRVDDGLRVRVGVDHDDIAVAARAGAAPLAEAGLSGPAPAVHAVGRQLADLVLRQPQDDLVRLDLLHRADRDRDLAPPPQVAALEHDVGDVVLGVDDEAVDVPEVVAVRRRHRARAADLDVALRHPVVAEHDVRVRLERLGRDALEVRQAEHVLDADVPSGSATGNSPRRRYAVSCIRSSASTSATVNDSRTAAPSLVARVDRHDARLVGAVVRPDDEVGDAARRRVDDEVGELAELRVGAVDRAAEVEPLRRHRA